MEIDEGNNRDMRSIIDNYLGTLQMIGGFSYHQYTRYQRKALNKKLSIPKFSTTFAASSKRSDTLFIMGSGSSINAIPDHVWSAIEQHDSIGLNFWVLHDFIPNMLKFEIPVTPDERFNQFMDFLEAKRSDYSNCTILCNNRSEEQEIVNFIKSFSDSGNLFYPDYITAPGYSVKSLIRSLAWINKANAWKQHKVLVFKRSSLTIVLSIAALMDYKNVVLCGVDLNNAGYFYDDPYYQEKYPSFNSGQTSLVHRSNDPEIHPLTIEVIVELYQELLFKPNNKTIYIQNATSALYPILPLFS